MGAHARRLLLLVTAVTLVGACNDHSPVAVGSRRLVITDRGIAVPIPPPSLTDAPVVEATVFGSIVDDFPPGTEVHVEDIRGDAEATTKADDDAFEMEVDGAVEAFDFVFEGLKIDLTDNCLEMWIERGQDLSTYQAEISTDGGGKEIAVMAEVEECAAPRSDDIGPDRPSRELTR